MKAVYIEWLDHASSEMQWSSEETRTLREPFLVRSVGFILEETDTHIILVMAHTGEEETFFGESLILKNCITKRKALKLPA
jgi:hypothetical protein